MSQKNKLQTGQNDCIRFFPGMERRGYIGINHFQKSNWLPVKSRVDNASRWRLAFLNNLFLVYMLDIQTSNSSSVVRTRRPMNSFVEPIYMKEISRKSISYL